MLAEEMVELRKTGWDEDAVKLVELSVLKLLAALLSKQTEGEATSTIAKCR